MDLGLSGKVALVCASSKGIGKAAAVGLAAEGAKVVICARGAEALEATEKEIRGSGAEVLAAPCDVTDHGAAQALVKQAADAFGQVDILVNNAGGPPTGALMEHDDGAFVKALEQNLLSTVRLTRLVVPGMRERRWGRIINVTGMAVKEPLNDLLLSNMARTGVVGFAKTIATELAADNVLVNNVCPGVILTDRQYELSRARAKMFDITPEEELKRREQEIPMKRGGTMRCRSSNCWRTTPRAN